MNAVAENAGDFLDNRQAKAQATVLIRALHITALELLEDFFQAIFSDAHPAVPDLNRQALLMTPTTQHHATAVGITNSVAQQIAQDARQQLDVAAYQGRTGDEMQLQAFAARHLGVFGGEVFQQFAQGERRNIGLDHTGI
ncbi:hypothetical protein D3C76_1190600 [compost metagenome]